MKKFVTIVCAIALGVFTSFAGESESVAANNASVESSTADVRVPTGAFFNGSNCIKVEKDWVGLIFPGRKRVELDFTAQMDPFGNYLLRLENGECITIEPNGITLHYNDVTYEKQTYY